ncbi:hypothetical protein RRG08_029765 [Elysia crispata]|uniref:Uncharacterized protein n=1 Tax=Elysia crispata TaxID=231223 RepID=A0AAE1B5S5_9GAST|nr:hypothetical protein RRG08_029765 [Elysia crispata]
MGSLRADSPAGRYCWTCPLTGRRAASVGVIPRSANSTAPPRSTGHASGQLRLEGTKSFPGTQHTLQKKKMAKAEHHTFFVHASYRSSRNVAQDDLRLLRQHFNIPLPSPPLPITFRFSSPPQDQDSTLSSPSFSTPFETPPPLLPSPYIRVSIAGQGKSTAPPLE